MHVPQEFPKWKYHRELPARIVDNAEQEAALGNGWADTPAAFAEPAVEAAAETQTAPETQAQAVEESKPAKQPKAPKQPKQAKS